jgi:serine phosphatase RsbU (regulator of sigma subunit)
MTRPVSIRTSLLRNLSTMVVLMGVAIFATTLVGARHAVRTLSESIVGKTLDTVEARLDSFFDEPAEQLRVMALQVQRGLLDLGAGGSISDPDARFRAERDRFNLALVPILDNSGQVSSLMVADGRGREHMLLRVGDQWRNRVSRADQWGGEVRWLEWSDGEGAAPSERREELDYDPRQRPWYRGAVAARERSATKLGDVHWTEPYTFFTTKEPGITASISFVDVDGLERVVGFDLLLNDISAFTRGFEVGQRGMVAVLTEDRRIIGLPGDPRFDDPQARAEAYLKRSPELGLTWVTDAASALSDRRPDQAKTARFHTGGEAWWGRVVPYVLSDEQHLWVAVVVPEADLLGNVLTQRFLLLGIVLVVLVVGVARAAVLSRRFSAPVEALVAQSDRISQGDLEPGTPVVSKVTEVRRLADAHDSMRESLKGLIKLEKLERDLDLARDIQHGLLPSGPPDLAGFEIAGWNQAADETGGDYYDWLTLPDGRLVATLADVTGHGIGPALIVAVCRAYMRASTTFGAQQLSEALGHVNDLLYADIPPERFVTAVVFLLDTAQKRLTMVSAGHGPILLYEARTGTIREWAADMPPLGVMDGIEFPPPHEIDLEAGDVLVLTTDGFFEWRNRADELYGLERLRAFVSDHHDLAPERFIETLYQDVLAFADGTGQEDDLTAVVLRRL